MSNLSFYANDNSQYTVLQWEPVSGSGERINVGAICKFKDEIISQPLIREDVLMCMYGAAGEGLFKLIQWTIETLKDAANKQKNLNEILRNVPLSNFSLTNLHNTVAFDEKDLLRQIALMNCSLSVLAEMTEVEDETSKEKEEAAGKQWPTKIKDVVKERNIDLIRFFNVESTVVDGGVPIRFGFLSSALVSNFSILSPSNIAGVNDARAKMWTLDLAKRRASEKRAALICGTVRPDDITVSDKQHNRLKSYLSSLEDEAHEKSVEFIKVYSEFDAADFIIEYA